MSLHCKNAVAKKRSIALNLLLAVRSAMIHEDVDIVVQAGGATQGQINNLTAPSKKRSKNSELPVPPGSSPLWGLGGIPSDQSERLIRRHGAFEIDRKDLSPRDQTSQHETWIHLSHRSTPLVARGRDQRDRINEPKRTQKQHVSKVFSRSSASE